jgi:phosphoglycolate phosphatase
MQGKKLVFVTNNSRKSRKQYSKKFKALGLEVTEVVFYPNRLLQRKYIVSYLFLSSLQEEIFTSSFAAAMFLKLNNFPPEKKVLYIILMHFPLSVLYE